MPARESRGNLVESAAIKQSSLFKPRPTYLQLHFGPFVALHTLTLSLWLGSDFSIYYGILGLVGLAAQVLLFLSCQWSVRVFAVVTHMQVEKIEEATHLLAIPPTHQGSPELCQLHRKESEDGAEVVEFSFQNRKYRFDKETTTFKRLRFEISESVEFYRGWKGYKTAAECDRILDTYGANQLNIPIPTFTELFKEQAVAPFFVFQVFCVLLWCLDEYWYYSLFTLFLLVTFESTVVASRLRNLKELRGMTIPVIQVPVYRERKWTLVSSDKVVPGDLISLVRQSGKEAVCPCDALLLEGTCITDEAMLTGESVPQLKEPVWGVATPEISIKKDKIHIVYSGTKILQTSNEKEPGQDHFKTYERGSLAYVLRTGFDTSQGKLMRMILFATERVTANNYETFLFILFLLVFAVAAAAYVVYNGLKDETRSRYYLTLNCIMIITSVIPPELPMELSLAVNNSLLALAKLGIFCTEPFRIPNAGKVDICCFDKTGTLTSDQLKLKGLVALGASKAESKLISPSNLPLDAERIIGGCHSLIQLDQKIIGDPMEMAAIKSMEWEFVRNDCWASTKEPKHNIRILHRNHFSSNLKRMSTVVLAERESESQMYCLAKGAPEVMATLLGEVPEFYHDVSKKYSQEGSRIISLAYKKIDSITTAQVKALSRSDVESNLQFAGFLIFNCPIKSDTKEVIAILQQSSHEVSMITGDHILTACHVARELDIIKKPAVNLREFEGVLEWRTMDDNKISKFTKIEETNGLIADHDLCITGEMMTKCQPEMLVPYLPYIRVFARVAPEQKEFVLKGLKDLGFHTLMCGDGTNDVGALKQAHIGIALLNKPFKQPQRKPQMTMQQRIAEMQAQQAQQARARSNAAALTAGNQSAGASNQTGERRVTSANSSGAKPSAAENMKKALDMMSEMDESSVVRLGDASIASPFIAKTVSISSCAHIIRQGRCTLVTTLEMYKILALNCLISAYTMSVLNLDGVKLGDTQATFAGMMIAMCFMFLSRAQPAERLSRERPTPNIFNAYVLSSIMLQFGLHLYTLITIVDLARLHLGDFQSKPEDEFKPNIMNTCVFLVSMTMQVSTFAINYRGRPFMKSIQENPPMFYTIVGTGLVTVLAASNMSTDIMELLALVPYPNDQFREEILYRLSLDFFGAFFCEKFALFLFGRTDPKPLPYLKARKQ